MKDIDWNAAWQEARRGRKADRRGNEYWNRRAPSFAKNVRETGYSRNFIRLMEPKAEWTVLDVGCGAGTLAMPLTGLVRRITAIDFSDVMISILEKRCREQGVTNITSRVVSWEDDWESAGIATHDVAIASRSLVVEDLRAALLKLDGKARHRVFISSLVGDGPFDRRIFEAIGRPLDRGPDYIYIYNLLNQMRILAEVTFVTNGDTCKVYGDIGEAVQGFQWMIEDMTAGVEILLRAYLEKQLVKNGEGWSLPSRPPVRWAVISWQKQPTMEQT